MTDAERLTLVRELVDRELDMNEIPPKDLPKGTRWNDWQVGYAVAMAKVKALLT